METFGFFCGSLLLTYYEVIPSTVFPLLHIWAMIVLQTPALKLIPVVSALDHSDANLLNMYFQCSSNNCSVKHQILGLRDGIQVNVDYYSQAIIPQLSLIFFFSISLLLDVLRLYFCFKPCLLTYLRQAYVFRLFL